MKIWILSHYGLSPKYHSTARTYNFGKCLKEKGHDVTIFTASTIHHTDRNLVEKGKRFEVEDIDGVKYVYIRTPNYSGNGIKRILNMCMFYVGVKKNWKKFGKPDVILAMSVHLLTCVAGIQIAKKVNCKCAVQIADPWPQTLIEFGKIKEKSILARVLYRLEYWVYKNADDVIFTMEGGKDYIKDRKWDRGIAIDKIHYINNGILLKDYEEQKERYHLDDEHLDNDSLFKIVYTGSIGNANALEYLIQTAETAKTKGITDMIFLIWGDGPKRLEFETYCKDHKISNVIFKGKVKKEMIPGILARSNVNILLGHSFAMYKYGISANKLFDYLAAGKPIVSNLKCGYDILERYDCGITVKSREDTAILEELIRIKNADEMLYLKWCNNAKSVAKEYDFELLTKKLYSILKNEVI